MSDKSRNLFGSFWISWTFPAFFPLPLGKHLRIPASYELGILFGQGSAGRKWKDHADERLLYETGRGLLSNPTATEKRTL